VSLSLGRQISIAVESISMPRKVMVVTGPSVFDVSRGRLADFSSMFLSRSCESIFPAVKKSLTH